MIPSHTWFFRCFGGLRLENGSQVIERFRTQKTASLLALLALNGTHSRERICALLWPDTTPEAARNSLSVALSALRRDLGEGAVTSDRQSIALQPELFDTDVRAFDRALKAGDFARALELYEGHLLPGFYEDPLPALAREYEEKARHAFASRLDELEGSAALDEILVVARRATVLFGDDERWFLAQMRAYRGRGDFDAALRIYENYGRSARKRGETTSETARALAKAVRRDKEKQSAIAKSPSAAMEIDEEVYNPEETASLPEEKNVLSNFPKQWTKFFGRENERAMLGAWLQSGLSLITLTGAGGSGKTRLSLETAEALSSEWGRVCFVPLAALSDPDLLPATICDALSLAPSPGSSPLQQLERALQEQRTLFLLDNFEQLVEGGVSLLQLLREKLPTATFVVTSRVLLNLPGEREFPVAPLPTPLQNTLLEAARQCPSVALFCHRAAMPLDGDNVEAISALCRRLDGIPLALELAAARAKMLSPAQILERVGSHPNFLQSREVGLPARHKTLRAAIVWSVDLLSPELRRLFTQLSLFRGGWSLEAVEAICDAPDALDSLTQLRENSLIFVEKEGDQARFRMLETLREFGAEELQGDERALTERAYFDYFLQVAQQGATQMQGPQQREWLSRLDAEQDNLRAALAWAGQHDSVGGLELSVALVDFWETRLRLEEGRHWLETFVEVPTQATDQSHLSAWARALSGIGRLAWYGSDLSTAEALLEQGIELARRANDAATEIYALRTLARVAPVLGSYERAHALGLQSVELSRATGDQSLLLKSLMDLGFADLNVLDFPGATTTSEEAVALAREEDDERALCVSLLTLCISLNYEVRLEEIFPLLDECEARCRHLGAIWELISCLALRSNVASQLGDFVLARTAYEELLRISPPELFLSWSGYNTLFGGVVTAFAARGDSEAATVVLAAIEALRESIGYTVLPFMVPAWEGLQSSLRKNLGEAAFEELWSRGRQLSPEQAVHFALHPDVQLLG